MAFPISPDRQDELLNGGFSTGCPIWYYLGGNMLPAIFISLRYDNRAGIAIPMQDGTWTPKHVRLRNISKRVSR